MTNRLKLKSPVKFLAFIASVITLSWFFEGCRRFSQIPSLEHLFILLLGIFATAFLVWLQALWIYIEEKSKGTLQKRIVHFDRLQQYFERAAASKKEGDCSRCD